MNLSRRKFVAAAGLLPAMAACGLEGPMTPVPGVQLYSVAQMLGVNPRQTLAMLRAMGVRSAELFRFDGAFLGKPLSYWAKAFDDAGLDCASAHASPEFFGSDGWLDKSATLSALGVKTLVCSRLAFPESPPGSNASLHDWRVYGARQIGLLTPAHYRRFAEAMNGWARALQPLGLRIAYHNHDFEFTPFNDGVNGFELLLRCTSPELVDFELDCGWAAAAGKSAPRLLADNADRFTLLHIKDVRRTANSTLAIDQVGIGEGTIDWTAIREAVLKGRVTTGFIEIEPDRTGRVMDNIASDVMALKRLWS